MKSKSIFLIAALLAVPPCYAKDAGDYQELADRAYPGKVVGLSASSGQVIDIQFADGLSDNDKNTISAYLSGAAKTEPTKKELDQRVADKKDELSELANDENVSDEKYEAVYLQVTAKLDRAKRLTDNAKKQQKLEDAGALLDGAKEARPK